MNHKTIMKFHGGLDTIGGNIISLVYNGYRIITDFGAVVGVDINELAYQKNTQALYDDNKLPKIDGLFRQEALEDNSTLSYEASDLKTIVLISHLHLDHVGSLAHLHPDIPVYATETAVALYHSLNKHEFLPDYPVNWTPVKPGETIEHGEFSITFHLSDHDTEGAASIFIKAPDVKVIYSGDLRLSGFHPERVMETTIKAKAFQPDILLLEGTSYSFSETIEPSALDKALEPLIERLGSHTEFGLMRDVRALIKDSDKLVAFNGYPQNVDRVVELAHLFNEYKRTFVLQASLYNLAFEYVKDLDHVAPLATEDASFGVTVQQIQANPEQFAIQVDEFTYEQLYDLPKGILLHSNGVPLGLFMEGYETYIRGLHDNGWRVVDAGVSGHASKEDLLAVAYTINAKVTVPWHTKLPELYSEALETYGVTTWLPEYNKQYSIDSMKELSK